MLGMAWFAPKANDVNGYAVDLLTKIIGGTESSRLVQSLRDRDHLVQSVRMSYGALAGAGIVTLSATMEPKNLTAVEAAVLAEIARVQEHGVSEEERQLAVTQAEARYAFDRETTEGLAFAYGIAELTWSLDEELRYIEALNAITRAELQEAARRWLSITNFVRIAFAPRKAAP